MPNLSAKSAEQVLLLSAVAQGPVLPHGQDLSPWNTNTWLTMLGDVRKFDSHPWGTDADW